MKSLLERESISKARDSLSGAHFYEETRNWLFIQWLSDVRPFPVTQLLNSPIHFAMLSGRVWLVYYKYYFIFDTVRIIFGFFRDSSRSC